MKEVEVKTKRPRLAPKTEESMPPKPSDVLKTDAPVASGPAKVAKSDPVEVTGSKKPIVEESTIPLTDRLTNAWNFVSSLDTNQLFAAPV